MRSTLYRHCLFACIGFCVLVLASCGERKWKIANGQPLPSGSLPDVAGVSHDFADYRGKALILNFFATWCPPCRAEMPHLQSAYKSMDKSKIAMVAVSSMETRKDVQKFVKKMHLGFTVLLDENHSYSEKMGIDAIPRTILVDPDGNIQDQVEGFDPGKLEDLINKAENISAAGK